MTSPHTEWITTSAAGKLYGLPQSLISQAILNGILTAKTVVGECLVSRSEVTAMALRMRLQHCGSCGDD